MPTTIMKKIKLLIKEKPKKPAGHDELRRCILNQITRCPTIGDLFSTIYLQQMVENDFSLEKMYNLFTILSFIELTMVKSSSLEDFQESVFA